MANVIWSDSFNRASFGSNDNAFGGTSVHPWSAPNGSVSVYENALGGNSTLTFYRYGVNPFPCPAGGIFLEGPATRFDGFNDMGISARWISTTDHAFVAFNATQVYIFSRVANTGLTVASVPFVVKPGDLLGMYANGQHYEAWVNGVKVTEYDEARIAAAGTIAVRSPYNGANFRVDQMIAYDAIPYLDEPVRSGSATLTTSTILQAAGRAVRKAAATLSTVTALSGAGKAIRRGAAALQSSTVLTGAGRAVRRGEASASTTATLTAAGSTTRRGDATLSTETIMDAGGRAVMGGEATLGTAHTITLAGYSPGLDEATGAATLTTATTLEASGRMSPAGTAVLSTVTVWEVEGHTVRAGSTGLSTETTVEAGGRMVPAGAATLNTRTAMFFGVESGWAFTSVGFGEPRHTAGTAPREHTAVFGERRWETEWRSR